jgi:hypothetical protein
MAASRAAGRKRRAVKARAIRETRGMAYRTTIVLCQFLIIPGAGELI